MMVIVWDAKQDLLAVGHVHALPKWFELRTLLPNTCLLGQVTLFTAFAAFIQSKMRGLKETSFSFKQASPWNTWLSC